MMMPTLVEVIRDRQQWESVLRNFPSYDFVHTYDFHDISRQMGEGSPILFSAKDESGNILACWPALERAIAGTGRFDLGCVYGYGGPLLSDVADPSRVSGARDQIITEMHNGGWVSVFSRLHPLFSDSLPADQDLGMTLGEVVVLDTRNGKKDLQGYRYSHKSEIKKARNLGVSTVVDEDCDGIASFVDIYQQSMRDLNADEYYMFDDAYFRRLADAMDFRVFIIFAVLDGVKIAASMFIHTRDVLQYFLSGTVAAYKKLSPSKCIIAEAHGIAVSLGVNNFVLGGGVGSRDDALFRFKKGFTDRTKPFRIFKKVLDPDAYQQFCALKGVDSSRTSFFPAYRTS